jgi:nitroimidazol reductase NimA-like FMN-containing flavoprotein (pyridoxamine 5'-phosphate oxidase superfamily)
MFGNLNSSEIEELLHRETVGRIGCYADGMVYVVPISYAYDGAFVYACTQEGMKLNMMRKNPKICFEVDSFNDMGNWKSVIGWGDFEELEGEPDREMALNELHHRVLPMSSSATAILSSEWPFAPTNLGSIKGVVFRLKLTRKTGRFERNSIPSFLAWG